MFHVGFLSHSGEKEQGSCRPAAYRVQRANSGRHRHSQHELVRHSYLCRTEGKTRRERLPRRHIRGTPMHHGRNKGESMESSLIDVWQVMSKKIDWESASFTLEKAY